MVWDTCVVEKGGLQLCSMENSTKGRRKRKIDANAGQVGAVGSSAASAIVAGAWLTPQKKVRTTLEVCDMNNISGFGPMMITAEDLARTLDTNALMLVGDGAGFTVLERP
jgi:hypothetical protein